MIVIYNVLNFKSIRDFFYINKLIVKLNIV